MHGKLVVGNIGSVGECMQKILVEQQGTFSILLSLHINQTMQYKCHLIRAQYSAKGWQSLAIV
jgi:hypothetical protein